MVPLGIVFDTGKAGLRTVLKDWQEAALRAVWDSERPLSSSDVWIEANMRLGEAGSISRASVINFLQAMAVEGVLLEEHRSGKGGYHGIYAPKLDEEGYKLHVAKTVISKLSDMWPDATKEALMTSRTLGS